jgi:predicted dehydrogenase
VTAAWPLPASRVPDPRAAPSLRWGVLGTGWIAERFVAALQQRTTQRVVAVGSRTKQSAGDFAGRLRVPRAHASYQALADDPDVDVVYVATPHNAHLPCAELVLRAGKPVLVEKPLALNASEAARIAALAVREGLFCAEAMWTFFLPKYDVIAQVVDSGVLGDLRTVIADHGEHFAADHRILRQDLAGGPMLDLGTYPVAFALRALGPADAVQAIGTPAPTGVNGQVGILLGHGSDRQSVLHTSLFSNTPTGAVVAGTAGTLTVPGVFYRPGPFVVDLVDGSPPSTYDEPTYGYDGLAYEAAECARRIAAGERETEYRPLADSVATLATMDEVRRSVGAVFDEER